jgi:hypothetical protein
MLREVLAVVLFSSSLACSAGSASPGEGTDTDAAPAPPPTVAPADARCDDGYHDCLGTCVDDTSPATCGTSCTPCLVGDWAEPRCDGKACRMTCFPFHADCDHEPSNGCESLLTADAANCGFCGNACDHAACVDGMCQATKESN